jgi:hypothetical protein
VNISVHGKPFQKIIILRYVAMYSGIQLDTNVLGKPAASIFRAGDLEDGELDERVSDASSPGTRAEDGCGADGQ